MNAKGIDPAPVVGMPVRVVHVFPVYVINAPFIHTIPLVASVVPGQDMEVAPTTQSLESVVKLCDE
jgi:hypothetical protein